MATAAFSPTSPGRKVVVLDYGMGNLRSVVRALEAVGAEVTVSAEPATIAAAERLIFPGQGAFGQCMTRLGETGLADAIATFWQHQRPYLGICLGLQILFESSEEHGPVKGLGALAGDVVRFSAPASSASPDEPRLKVPHMGWNQVRFERPHPLVPPLERDETTQTTQDPWFYFVHSYFVRPADPELVLATSEHGPRFTVAVAKDALMGVQFHPEKSHTAGLTMLDRFMAL